MTNTSATGGYLAPAATPTPLEGQQLLDFIQLFIVGVTGMDGTLVRPFWQTEPPNIPTAGVAWCAFRVDARPSDEYPYVEHVSNESFVGDKLQRHEDLILHAIFYDLGSGGQADALVGLLRDGSAIAQNREALAGGGLYLVRAGAPTPVPVLLKLRWSYRVDLEIVLRRQIDRVYPVLDLVGADGTLNTDGGLAPQNWRTP